MSHALPPALGPHLPAAAREVLTGEPGGRFILEELGASAIAPSFRATGAASSGGTVVVKVFRPEVLERFGGSIDAGRSSGCSSTRRSSPRSLCRTSAGPSTSACSPVHGESLRSFG